MAANSLWGSAGDMMTFKVFVHLTTGNQAGSNPVTITRL
jgi:hypothetical protein